jgi:hypothetical protein
MGRTTEARKVYSICVQSFPLLIPHIPVFLPGNNFAAKSYFFLKGCLRYAQPAKKNEFPIFFRCGTTFGQCITIAKIEGWLLKY